MNIVIRDQGQTCSIDALEGESVLEALRKSGFVVDAPCGGAGRCKKCRMLIADPEGVSWRLACQTPVVDDLEVTLEHSHEMSVSMGAESSRWTADGKTGEYGLAIDVGTTTLVMRLYDLASGEILGARGASNPQLAYGADVISRISAASQGALLSMANLLGDTLVQIAKTLLAEHKISKSDISRITLAGNTTMQLIACAIDPTPIGAAPFVAPTLFGDLRPYAPFEDAGIGNGNVWFAPCVAAYVGGDITAGELACALNDATSPVLFMDLGTNGEMALGDCRGITCCATAAGPVFEGANVKYGMPAYPGAISKIAPREDAMLDIEVIGNIEPIGICGTGLFDAIALLIERGIIDKTGRFKDVEQIDATQSGGLEELVYDDGDGPAFHIADHISVTQKDVRNLQLAKASMCAGVLTMVRERNMALSDISRVIIAGGFGEYLNLSHAAAIGIFPPEFLDRAESVGNTAIEGASDVVVSHAARDEIVRITSMCDYIELSTSATFNELYVKQMYFE